MSETEVIDDFFEQLQQRMCVLAPQVEFGLKRDAWLFGLIALGCLLALTPLGLQLEDCNGVLAWAGIGLQVVGLTLLTGRQLGDVLPEFQDASRKFAIELDSHFGRREDVVDWLQSFLRKCFSLD